MALTLAIFGLVTALVPLGIWWFKRRRSRTPEERRDDLDAQIEWYRREIYLARVHGDDARADALLRLLRDISAAGGQPGGQRDPGGTAGGNNPAVPIDPRYIADATAIHQRN